MNMYRLLYLLLFSFLALLFYAGSVLEDIKEAKKCTHVKKAEIILADKKLTIPAIKGTTIRFAYDHLNPRSVYQVDVENKVPWSKETKGFCEEHLVGESLLENVNIKSHAIGGIAASLELPSHETIKEIYFGFKGKSAWLVPSEVSLGNENSEEMVYRNQRESSEINHWQFTETKGWLKSGFHISSFCSNPSTKQVRCGVRVTRRSDGLIFEAWGLELDNYPLINEPPPDEYIQLTRKLPNILDLYY